MRLLVVGAGATGGYFGGRLAEAGRDVTFLVRPARAQQLRRTGLQIRSPVGDVTLTPKTVTADAIDGPFDAVLLSVKAYALEPAMTDMAPAVGPETAIVPVLNGMRHLEALQARFGAGRVLGGVCRIAGDLDPDGRIVQMSPMHDLLYGELDGSITPRVQALDAAMQGSKFAATLSTRIETELWNKWLMLASLGGITCMMRGTVGDVAAAPSGEQFAHRFIDEVVAVMAAAGHKPGEKQVAFVRTTLTAKGSSFASSMFRDLQKGRPVEAEQIVGDMLARAMKLGVDTPLLLAAATHLASYQARLAG